MTAAINKKSDLTQGPLLSKIILFSLPLMATGVLSSLFSTADTIMVGRWGGATVAERESALAAVGSCGSLITLIISVFMGLSAGTGVCMAHAIGAKREEEAQKVVHTAVMTGLIGGLIVGAIGFLFAPSLLRMMNTPESVLKQAVPYIRAYFCGIPAHLLYNYCASMLRSSGDTTRPFLFLSIAGVVNVLLNFIMIVVFHMGAVGVGIATAASHWISCLLILRHLTRQQGYCHLDFKKISIDRSVMKKILTIGLPAGFQSSLFSVSNIIIQSSINSFGDVVIAGNTAAANLDGYVYICQNSLYHTAMTFVGQNVGAKKPDRIKKSIFYSAIVVAVTGLLMGNLIRLCGPILLQLYAPGNTEVIAAGIVRLSIMASTYFLCGLVDVGNGTLRAFGKSLVPMLITLAGSCLIRIVWVYTIFQAFTEQKVLYYSYPISWIITSASLFIFAAFVYRDFKKQNPEIEELL